MILQTFLIFMLGLQGLPDCMDYLPGNQPQDDLYLIVVDMQQFDYKKAEVERSAKELTGTINELLTHFDPDKIIYIKSASLVLNVSFKGIRVDTLPTLDFDTNLKLVGDNIFTKEGGDAFTTDELNEFLEKKSVRSVALVGLMAEKCVYDTALGGLEHGYEIFLIPEGIIGTTEKKKEKAIRKMQAAGIKVLTMDDIPH